MTSAEPAPIHNAGDPEASSFSAPQTSDAVGRKKRSNVTGFRPERLSWGDIGLLAFLLFGAFLLRSANINFDAGTHQHPDERFWSIVLSDVEWADSVDEYLSSSTSPMNPYNPIKSDGSAYGTYSYGTMPLFATKGAAQWLSGGADNQGMGTSVTTLLTGLGLELRMDKDELNPDRDLDLFDDRYNANLIGRLLSAIMDTGTVALVFFLGRTLGGRTAGFAGAGLYALAALPIQYAHFLGSEPWVSFFVTATILVAVRIARGRAGIFTYVLAGIVGGLAVASKLSGLPAVVAPALAALIAFAVAGRSLSIHYGETHPRDARRKAGGSKSDLWKNFLLPVVGVLTSFIVGFLVFRLMLPYAFRDGLNPSLRGLLARDWQRAFGLDDRYMTDMAYIRDVNTGGGFPWVIQWAGRTPLLYPLQQLFKWGMGPAHALAVVAGMGVAGIRVVRDRQWHFAVPLSVIGVFVVFVALQFNPLNRYLLPAYPAALALAGFGLVQLWRSVRPSVRGIPDEFFHWWRPCARAAVGLMALGGVLYGLAFVNGVYRSDYTRITASEWLVENVEPGSKVSGQLWDDTLPLDLPTTQGWRDNITHVSLDPFFPDSQTKATQLAASLDEIDYIVEASNKLYGAIPRQSAKYPSTVQYYEALFDGRLGFEQVVEFTTPPSLFGIQFQDVHDEETFTVYDHPPVTIWKKTAAYSSANTLQILDPFRANTGIDHPPRAASANALQLTPAQYEAQQSGGTWTETFDEDGFVTRAPWVWWLLWLQLAAFASVPLTTWLFRRMPDQGYGFSKVIGFLAVGLPVWLLANWGWFDFSDTLAWSVLAGVVILGLLTAVVRRAEFSAAIAANWRSWMMTEAVFLSLFAMVVLLRYANPDLWSQYRGGEKPMELSYLTAIVKSTTLPAYDPWFAGGFLNYYYVGWFFLAVPIKALHMPPDIGFNLGLATYAALAGTVVYSLVANLAGEARARMNISRGVDRPARSSALAGLLGVFMFLILGNFDSLRQTWRHLRQLNQWDTLDGKPGDSLVETAGGTWQWLFGDGSLQQFDWWDPSRVNKGTGDITEFPAWSFLFGDLHPHLMGMVFLGLGLAFAAAFVMTLVNRHSSGPQVLAAQANLTRGDIGRSWGLVLGMGTIAAVVRMVHTWDWPTVLIVSGSAIVLGWLISARSFARSSGFMVAQLVAFGLAYLFVSAPYLANNDVFSSGFQLSTPSRTNLDDYVAHFLLFIVAAALYGLTRFRQIAFSERTWMALGVVVGMVAPISFLILNSQVGSVAAWSSFGFLGMLMLATTELAQARAQRSIGHTATSGFFALGFAIITGVEFVRLASDSQGFNTVFKFWLQVWQLFAIAGAFAIWWVIGSVTDAIRTRRARQKPAVAPWLLRAGLLAGLAVLMLGALVFPIRAVPGRVADVGSGFEVADDPLSLEGFSWLDGERNLSMYNVGDVQMNLDAGIIDFLRSEVEGSPTIVEAWGEGYQWYNRISMTTGLPSVLGWDWHQRQQRACTAPGEFCTSDGFGRPIDERKSQLQQFYTVPDVAQAERFLLTYDVKYVIVGAMELATRRADNQPIEPVMAESVEQMFREMNALTPVYRDGRAVVYEVDLGRLRVDTYRPEVFTEVASG